MGLHIKRGTVGGAILGAGMVALAACNLPQVRVDPLPDSVYTLTHDVINDVYTRFPYVTGRTTKVIQDECFFNTSRKEIKVIKRVRDGASEPSFMIVNDLVFPYVDEIDSDWRFSQDAKKTLKQIVLACQITETSGLGSHPAKVKIYDGNVIKVE